MKTMLAALALALALSSGAHARLFDPHDLRVRPIPILPPLICVLPNCH
jgi:hypothetical protein